MILALLWTLLEAAILERLVRLLFALLFRLVLAARKSDVVRDGLVAPLTLGVRVIGAGLFVAFEHAGQLVGERFRFLFRAFFSHTKRIWFWGLECKLLFLRIVLVTLIFSQVDWERYEMVQIYEYKTEMVIDGARYPGTVSIEVQGDDFKPEILLVEWTPQGGRLGELDPMEFNPENFPDAWDLFTQDWGSDLQEAAEVAHGE